MPDPADISGPSASRVSERTKVVLWARAAGRCQYDGCNVTLIGDFISGNEDANFGFVAHIVASKPGGPRGDKLRSPQLRDDVANLMLLCHKHHKLIDVDEEDGHPESRLLAMKHRHEDRIAVTAAIAPDKASHMLRYAAKIGAHESLVSYPDLAAAMLPDRFPASGRSIDIELTGFPLEDHDPQYWATEQASLRRKFRLAVQERLETREIGHLSIFALAPMPLLIELGSLVGDITPVDVYQRHREPTGWGWPDTDQRVAFELVPPQGNEQGPPALLLSISADIVPSRIHSVLGGAAIWTVKVSGPHNDIVKSRQDLLQFRALMRQTFNTIKLRHGQDACLHIFPAMPASLAVELGRTWMPKADLPMLIYDQNRKSGGFLPALRIEQVPPS